MNWWLIGITIAVTIILLIQLSILIFVLPAIKTVLLHLGKSVGALQTSVTRLKMVVRYEEGVDVDQEQPFEQVKSEKETRSES